MSASAVTRAAPPPRVIVLGDVITDVIATTTGTVAEGSDTAARIVVGEGGAGGNVAAWLCALGVDVGLIARVGGDAAGRDALRGLIGAGVQVAASTDPHEPTGTVVALVGAAGERSMLTDRGANRMLRVEDLPGPWFRPGAHLHLSGYALFDGPGRAAGEEALRRAHAVGMTASVDPASWAPLERFGVARFLDATRTAAVCLPNSDEARVLAGADDPEVAVRTLGGLYGIAAVTCGPAGAVWSDGTAVLRCRAAPTAAVDTTGAGDAFTAGFLAAWCAGAAPDDALAGGTAAAARAIARPGARPGARP